MKRIINEEALNNYRNYLILNEKSIYTIEKYERDIKCFVTYANGEEISKELVIRYKDELNKKNYKKTSINSMLTSLNCMFNYLEWYDCRVKGYKLQKKIYVEESRELNKNDYVKLLEVSKNNLRNYLILETFASTGIRVSELKYFTVEQIENGEVEVTCKNKTRTILLPSKLQKKLLNYARKNNIKTGAVFVSRNGIPLSRHYIWRIMKKMCEKASVISSKVFPHNFRKLFARTFYKIEKDIAKLADFLGHYNINTTRLYIMSSKREHKELINRVGLIYEKATLLL